MSRPSGCNTGVPGSVHGSWSPDATVGSDRMVTSASVAGFTSTSRTAEAVVVSAVVGPTCTTTAPP